MVNESEFFGSGPNWRPDAELEALLECQRGTLQSALGGRPLPQVGDVWVSSACWSRGAEEGLAAMVVILRSFSEAWFSQPLFDVAPVSEDDRLASEWSLILNATQSGIGLPLVVHVDIQCTTTSSMLTRRLGALSDHALADLRNLVRAYAMGDTSMLHWCVGRAGRISIRLHPEWDEFARDLLAIVQVLSGALATERELARNSTSHTTEEDADVQFLAVASGGRPHSVTEGAPCHWEYHDRAPFIFSIGCDRTGEPRLLGEAIAIYYGTSTTPYGVKRAAPRRLDPESFERLRPLLDVPLAPLCTSPNTPATLREMTGELVIGQLDPQIDLPIIVESVRSIRLLVGASKSGTSMRLAARRHTAD